MKNTFLHLACTLTLGSSAFAQTVLFDFGRHDGGAINTPPTQPTGNGNVVAGTISGGVATGPATPIGGSGTSYWNSVGLTTQNQTSTNPTFTSFVNVNNGTVSGWSISNLVNVQGNGFQNGGLILDSTNSGSFVGINPSATNLGTFAVANATGDYWYADGTISGNPSATFTLGGLDSSKTYNFTLFASRWGTSDRFTHYTISGNNTGTGFLQSTGSNIGADGTYDANDDQLLTIAGIAPNLSGNITVTWYGRTTNTTGTPNSFGYINAMQVTVIPEPSTSVLLACGLTGLLIFRRRGRKLALIHSCDPGTKYQL